MYLVLAEKSDRRKNQTGEEDGCNDAYDIGSSVSTSTMASLRDFDAAEAELLEDDPWENALEALYEKRRAQHLHLTALSRPPPFLIE